MAKLLFLLLLLFSLEMAAQNRSSAPTAVSASNDKATGNQVFKWLPPPSNDAVTYKIKIVEILGDQSPEQALHTNKPFFEKDSLSRLTTSYPPNAPHLMMGKKYAWAVESKNKEGKSNGFGNVMVLAGYITSETKKK
jgi:hypothetical protein